MPSFLRHADALLVSLRADPVFALTIPGKVQSYLQSGVPIVAMLDGEGARVIEESGAGLTCPAGDSEGLARAVLSLSALSPEERMAMGRRGANYAAREFSRERADFASRGHAGRNSLDGQSASCAGVSTGFASRATAKETGEHDGERRANTRAPVVLTGATGFVGGHLARALRADGAEVRSFDRSAAREGRRGRRRRGFAAGFGGSHTPRRARTRAGRDVAHRSSMSIDGRTGT